MAAKTVHFHVLWAKERIGEMDAALAWLRRQAKKSQGLETARLVADLTKRRDRFATAVKDQARAGEIAWRRAGAQLEREWKGFENMLHRHLNKTGQKLGLRQSAFQRLSGAQSKAWRGATTALQRWKNRIAPARRRGVAAALSQIKTEARAVQARARKLNKAGTTSWSEMRTALSRSRRAFDRAHRRAGRAIRQAMK